MDSPSPLSLKICYLYGINETLLKTALASDLMQRRSRTDMQIRDMRALLRDWHALLRIFASDTAARHWLHHANRRLQGRSPIEFLEHSGVRAFHSLISELVVGGYG